MHPRIHRVLDRVFGKAEEINGKKKCPTYLYRWAILKSGRPNSRGVYVHRFVGDDWSLDLHDHPKRFISIGLWGSYIEFTPAGRRRYRAPWIRSFPAEHRHRIALEDGRGCWTLVVVLRATREWGFWHEGAWTPWKAYIDSEVADRMKSCP